jgi:hypothetical protein
MRSIAELINRSGGVRLYDRDLASQGFAEGLLRQGQSQEGG